MHLLILLEFLLLNLLASSKPACSIPTSKNTRPLNSTLDVSDKGAACQKLVFLDIVWRNNGTFISLSSIDDIAKWTRKLHDSVTKLADTVQAVQNKKEVDSVHLFEARFDSIKEKMDTLVKLYKRSQLKDV